MIEKKQKEKKTILLLLGTFSLTNSERVLIIVVFDIHGFQVNIVHYTDADSFFIEKIISQLWKKIKKR